MLTTASALTDEVFRKGGVAAELSKLKFPETMIIGDEKGSTPLEALIGAAMAKQLTSGKIK